MKTLTNNSCQILCFVQLRSCYFVQSADKDDQHKLLVPCQCLQTTSAVHDGDVALNV